MSDVERKELHETTWTGTLTEDQLKSVLLKAICDEAGVNAWEQGLTFSLDSDAEAKLHRFVLVKDELWYRKREAA